MATTEKRGGCPMTLAPGVKTGLLDLVSRYHDGLVVEQRDFANLNDAGVAILAEHFGFAYEPTELPPRELKDSDYTNWSMPLRLRQKINRALDRENDRLERRGEAKLKRDAYLNAIFLDYLDARRSVLA